MAFRVPGFVDSGLPFCRDELFPFPNAVFKERWGHPRPECGRLFDRDGGREGVHLGRDEVDPSRISTFTCNDAGVNWGFSLDDTEILK